MNPILRRFLTAAVLLAVFVPAIFWAPERLWNALVALVVGLAAFEWARLSAFPPVAARLYALVLGIVTLLAPAWLSGDWPAVQMVLFALAAVFWLGLAPFWLMGHWAGRLPAWRAAVGVVLLLPTAAALLYLHARGPLLLLGVLGIVWVADSAAYFFGRRFGRHKLAPVISPGKTWEGLAGALVALGIYAAVLSHFAGLPLGSLFLVLVALLYLSVLGDLFESWIKRLAHAKDSGSLLPGHGGVLDRVDAMTSSLPIAAGMLMWLEIT